MIWALLELFWDSAIKFRSASAVVVALLLTGSVLILVLNVFFELRKRKLKALAPLSLQLLCLAVASLPPNTDPDAVMGQIVLLVVLPVVSLSIRWLFSRNLRHGT